MSTLSRIIGEYRTHRGDWDALCNQCGQCCYNRFRTETGEVVVDFSSPCEFLDTETHLCKVFDERFRKCPNCGKVNLATALFHPTLPSDCAYAKTFRVWKK
ncbi:MAG: hypothetical protein LIO46_05255 [Clostridiales bacterium]|nr:hypothetical protein [Clostridiales bacterium]